MKGKGFVMLAVVCAPLDLVGVHVAGADQLRIASPASANPGMRTAIKHRNEARDLSIGTSFKRVEDSPRDSLDRNEALSLRFGDPRALGG